MNIKIFCRCSLFPSWSGYGIISILFYLTVIQTWCKIPVIFKYVFTKLYFLYDLSLNRQVGLNGSLDEVYMSSFANIGVKVKVVPAHDVKPRAGVKGIAG